MRQLRYDHSAIQVTREMGCSNTLTVEPEFVGKGRENIVVSFIRYTSLIRKGLCVNSLGASIYWRKNLSNMSDSVEDHNETEIVEASPVWNKDPFLRIKMDVRVPTLQVGQVEADVKEEGEDKEDDLPIIHVVEPRNSKRKTSKLDLEGKGVSLSTEKLK